MENPGSSKKRVYTKSRLVKELAFRSGITQNQARAALEAIIEIAYREAKTNFFILPGLCKFDVVRRKARNVRNPATGEMLVLPERDALRVALSKRAKETVVPRVAPMKPEEYAALAVAESAAVEQAEAAEPAAEPAAAEPAPAVEEPPVQKPAFTQTDEPPKSADDGFVDAPEVKGDKAISFFCPTCGQEVIAPEETVGYEAECPACGAIIIVPEHSAEGSTYASHGEASKKEIISSNEVEDLNPQVLKNRTIRIDTMLFADQAAQEAQQAEEARRAAARKSSTMRIDLPDEF